MLEYLRSQGFQDFAGAAHLQAELYREDWFQQEALAIIGLVNVFSRRFLFMARNPNQYPMMAADINQLLNYQVYLQGNFLRILLRYNLLEAFNGENQELRNRINDLYQQFENNLFARRRRI